MLIILFGLLIMGAFGLLGYKSDLGNRGDYFGQKEDGISAEVNDLRSQPEIIAGYRDNMTNLLGTLDRVDDYQEILARANAGFLDIYVPNDMRDLHLRALLDIKRFEEGSAVSAVELKDFIKTRVEELLRKNNELDLRQ